MYVLLTHTVGTKKASSLILIDTATRKEVKEKPNLPELARDLTQSPDGKTLIIIDDMNAKLKTMGGVTFFDTASLTRLKSVSLRDGPTLDVAPLAGGGCLASVVPCPTNQPAGGPGVGPGGMGPGMGPGGVPGPGGIEASGGIGPSGSGSRLVGRGWADRVVPGMGGPGRPRLLQVLPSITSSTFT